MKIKKILGREILDSRGFPTVECSILLEGGRVVKAAVPSGASVGKHEAIELRDGDEKRYSGKGVLRAIENVEKKIAPLLIGKEPDLFFMDNQIIQLDGSENKSNLGANATLSVSMAVARAQALSENMQLYELISRLYEPEKVLLPKVMFNVLNGGVHADSGIPFQEFMIMPLEQEAFSRSLQIVVTIYHNLKKLLRESGYRVGVGDEGGFAPRLGKNNGDPTKTALGFLAKATEYSGFVPGKDVAFCLDVAATQFYNEKENLYILKDKKLNSEEMIEMYAQLLGFYPIYSIEDGLHEQDWDGWKNMTESLGSKVQLVGDDIFVTNPKLIKKGIDQGVANATLIKPNQIGTVTQTFQAIKICNEAGYKTVVSHRSGETCDTFIADLVVGAAGGQFKAGAPCRGERVAKYNRLLEIEDSLEK